MSIFLRKDRVRDADVERFAPTVRDDKSVTVLIFQELLKSGADSLNRISVNRHSVDGRSDALDPQASKNAHIMLFQQVKNRTKKEEGGPALVPVARSQIFS
jgi:hypothetical protein